MCQPKINEYDDDDFSTIYYFATLFVHGPQLIQRVPVSYHCYLTVGFAYCDAVRSAILATAWLLVTFFVPIDLDF